MQPISQIKAIKLYYPFLRDRNISIREQYKNILSYLLLTDVLILPPDHIFNEGVIYKNADFIKIGNAATEKEMNAEISFLQQKRVYSTFDIPQLLGSISRADGATFNIQITKEFVGDKVEPILTQEIVEIYEELSKDKKNGLEFSHGDFAPWNLKRNGDKYTLFDWEHCGYRMPGFDLMHYATIVQKVLNGKELSEAFDEGLKNIHQFLPDFAIEKEGFLKEFEKLRTQIS